jgi:hypothetical protein
VVQWCELKLLLPTTSITGMVDLGGLGGAATYTSPREVARGALTRDSTREWRVGRRRVWCQPLGRPSAARPLRGYLQPSFSISFSISVIYRLLYKILSSISHFSPTKFSKSRSLYIKPYIRNVFCSKFLYIRIYHTSNAMDIFYFYLIQCLKYKEK